MRNLPKGYRTSRSYQGYIQSGVSNTTCSVLITTSSTSFQTIFQQSIDCNRNTYIDPSDLFLGSNNLDKDHLDDPFSEVVSECAWPKQNKEFNHEKNSLKFYTNRGFVFFPSLRTYTPIPHCVYVRQMIRKGFSFLNDSLFFIRENMSII